MMIRPNGLGRAYAIQRRRTTRIVHVWPQKLHSLRTQNPPGGRCAQPANPTILRVSRVNRS